MYRKTIRSGNVIEIITVKSKRLGMPAFRSGAYTPVRQDAEKRRAAELLNQVRELSRIINCNFKSGDLFITLTFRNKVQPGYDEAERCMRKFLRAVRTIRRLRNMSDLKYVSVIDDRFRGCRC